MSAGAPGRGPARLGLWLSAIVVGPAVALAVTWQSSLSIARIDGGSLPASDVVGRLRSVPSDDTLRELEAVSTGTSGLGRYGTAGTIAAAEALLDGRLTFRGERYGARVFDAGSAAGNLDSLRVCSFAVPALLVDAFEVSGDVKYLEEAMRYVAEWSDLETSLLVPRGLVFNDHAIAARAIIVTELWRHYRGSSVFEPGRAAELLRYVKKLSNLLLHEPLYEYRSNHGIMQNLSLLHLAIAFPLLDTADESRRTGKERLLQQLELYVNREGVILEHSSAYHRNGLVRLAAGWRYLGMLGEPVPRSLADRYRKALEFQKALRRPDLTLPPIGDTPVQPYPDVAVAVFDEHSLVSGLRRKRSSVPQPPERLTAAPGAGWIVLWDGLGAWPNGEDLAQTVLHWGNFPTHAHKHADELGLSLWSGGVQWVRGIGYWPYDRSRARATGWRSSNAPHWLEESPAIERSARLTGSAVGREAAFFDVVRANAHGGSVRRQLVRLAGGWFVIDSFDSESAATAEVVWRLPPDVTLERASESAFRLVAREGNRDLRLQVLATAPVNVMADVAGTAEWNQGVIVDGGEPVASPALRITSTGTELAILTAFVDDPAGAAVAWRWHGDSEWQIRLPRNPARDGTIRRHHDTLRIAAEDPGERTLRVTASLAESGAAARRAALAAFEQALRQLGEPWQSNLRRRVKATAAIAAAAAGQLLLLILVRWQRARWWPALTIAAFLSWMGLSLVLGVFYL